MSAPETADGSVYHPDVARFVQADDCACGNIGTHVCAQCDTFLCSKCAKASTDLQGERKECER